jgi:hypothetical protein
VKPVNKDGGRLPRCNPGDWCSSWSKHPIRDTRLSEGLSANHAVGQAWMWSASMQLARKDGAGGKLNSRGNVVIDCPPLCATTVFPRLFSTPSVSLLSHPQHRVCSTSNYCASTYCSQARTTPPTAATATAISSMSTPPRPPSRRGPNPFLLLGLAVFGTISFLVLTERRQQSQTSRDRPKAFHNPLLPPLDAEKVDQMPRRPVE